MLVGGLGNDAYIVDRADDQVIELAGQGTDTIGAYVSYTLPTEVEYLVLKGAAAIDGVGNALANRLTGNDAANRLDGLAGADVLEGGRGDDMLSGGGGDDLFVFRPGFGADRILDFTAGGLEDRMQFAGFGSERPAVTQVGADTVLTFAAGDTVTLVGADATQLTAKDWIWS